MSEGPPRPSTGSRSDAQSDRTGSGSDQTGAKEEKGALIWSIQEGDAHRKQGRKGPSRTSKRFPGWYVLLLVVAVANVYVWIGQPAWIFGDASGATTLAEEEGILRFRMYVQAQRIEAYRREHGVLPQRLEDTGEPFDGMTYQLTGPTTWELLGDTDRVHLLLRSTQPISEFLRPDQEEPGPGEPGLDEP